MSKIKRENPHLSYDPVRKEIELSTGEATGCEFLARRNLTFVRKVLPLYLDGNSGSRKGMGKKRRTALNN